ncbi:2,3-epoxybenzoyl-CoA dihydrolase [Candidatus Poriferisodalis sp.]|uniref:2,3-epoxybenzoyl-CoA dihydrolase n=1 Tax=Candidatus Poriferisodalis sp. TaxID=3101277 RepID=UPI003B0231C1
MGEPIVEFQTHPSRYHHWSLSVDGPIATLTMAVDPHGGLRDDYELKTNSYDLGVDIELADAVQRLRFEHPGVKTVVVTGGLDKVFCAGANIGMLAGASHGHKVNFCKFTNETRNGIEDATENSGQAWIAAVNGTAAGGGYELALACDEILLIDDRASAVSLPEIPLLGVLPGTGGLTRLVEKRHVRRDLADTFATRSEGLRAKAALEWQLVDHIAPASGWDDLVGARAATRAAQSDRPDDQAGIELAPLERTVSDDAIAYTAVQIAIDRNNGTASFVVRAPEGEQPRNGSEFAAAGAGTGAGAGAGTGAWILRAVRELDDAILHLRFNEPEIGTWVFRTDGDPDAVAQADSMFATDAHHWLVRETRLLWARTLSRLDVSARSLVTLIEPGSCFVGTLAELALVADRSFMLEGTWEELDDPPAPTTIRLTEANLGWYPMANDLTRLRTRFWGRDDAYDTAAALAGKDLAARDALDAGLVTFAPDDIDWPDEIRVMLEERNSFSPDALTGMEANFRFVGPETMTTKIFSRLSAWQNWIFQRPNAVGPQGALQRFGTGSRPDFDPKRV